VSEIPKGSRSNVEGGASGPTGDGAKVKYPKNEGTAEPKSGGTPSSKSSHHGRDKSIGR